MYKNSNLNNLEEVGPFIYKCTNSINNKIYIGQCQKNSLRNKINSHWRNRKQRSKYSNFFKDLIKFGKESFIWEIVEKCKKEELDSREEYWIRTLNSTNTSIGYNRRFGGSKSSFPEEVLQIIAKVNLGRKASSETRLKLSKIRKGKLNHFYGKKHSQETKNIISKKLKQRPREQHPCYGKPKSVTTKNKIRESKRQYFKPIICIETGQIFESIREAGKFLNIDRTCISRVLNGLQKTASSYTFKYIK